MNEIPNNGSEPGCIQYLIDQGLNIETLLLDTWERDKADYGGYGDPFNEEKFQKKMDGHLHEYKVRGQFIQQFGFAVLTRRAIEAIRPYAPILELGAGSGYWSYILQKNGIDTVATDPGEGRYGHFEPNPERRWDHHFTGIEQLNSVEAVRKYPDRNLLLVWPDLQDSWAADALDIFTGQVVIYEGEGEGGCTGDDRFHHLLEERFSNRKRITMPNFWGIHDDLIICKQPKQLKGKNESENSKSSSSI